MDQDPKQRWCCPIFYLIIWRSNFYFSGSQSQQTQMWSALLYLFWVQFKKILRSLYFDKQSNTCSRCSNIGNNAITLLPQRRDFRKIVKLLKETFARILFFFLKLLFYFRCSVFLQTHRQIVSKSGQTDQTFCLIIKWTSITTFITLESVHAIRARNRGRKKKTSSLNTDIDSCNILNIFPPQGIRWGRNTLSTHFNKQIKREVLALRLNWMNVIQLNSSNLT